MSKMILITGTSSVVGMLMALDFSGKGHRVIAAMRHVSTKNARIAYELGIIPNIEVVEMNVTKTESVNIAIEFAVKKYGQIDVLINNAGVTGLGLY